MRYMRCGVVETWLGYSAVGNWNWNRNWRDGRAESGGKEKGEKNFHMYIRRASNLVRF